MISKESFLTHWLGHRTLTRKTIEQFPEEALFTFSIGGMRPFADLVKEVISIAVPGLEGILQSKQDPYNHDLPLHTKAALLERWDADTPLIREYMGQLDEARLQETFTLFGQFEGTVQNHLWYLLDNEIHHRAQGFVYLRSLGITPPFFWERW
jgi:uncharacterized damage-inducible protein DinB